MRRIVHDVPTACCPRAESQTQQQFDLQVRPLSDTMAAAVTRLDLTQPLDDTTRDTIYDAFLKVQTLAFRAQRLSEQQQIDFSQRFATPERHTFLNQGTDALHFDPVSCHEMILSRHAGRFKDVSPFYG